MLLDVYCGFFTVSPVYHLASLETTRQKAILQQQYLVVIFADLQKAYDATWCHSIMQILHGCGLRDRLPVFLQILSHRTFRVHVGNAYSPVTAQENVFPQRSVLSAALFAVAVTGLPLVMHHMVQSSLFVDEFDI